MPDSWHDFVHICPTCYNYKHIRLLKSGINDIYGEETQNDWPYVWFKGRNGKEEKWLTLIFREKISLCPFF